MAQLSSVEALVAIAERLEDDERARSTAISARAATLSGFSGTILAVVATLGRDAFAVDLGAVGDPAARVLFITSVAALTIAVTFGIGGALRAQSRELVDVDVVRAFAKLEWAARDAVDIRRDWLVSLGRTLARDRQNNDRRARLAEHAATALLAGVLLLAAQALLLGAEALLDPGGGAVPARGDGADG